MSLQDIINWWNSYSKKRKEVVSCGAWPFTMPPRFDMFIDCCVEHDTDYHSSEIVYARGVMEQNLELKNEGLEIKKQADEEFCRCVRETYGNSNYFMKPLTKHWGEEYIELVLANGDRIWFSSVGVIIAENESGENPVMQTALRRAMIDGPTAQKEIIKQAYTLARTAKDGDRS